MPLDPVVTWRTPGTYELRIEVSDARARKGAETLRSQSFGLE